MKLPDNPTAAQFKAHIAAKFTKPEQAEKPNAKKKTLPYQTKPVQEVRKHIGEFCRKYPNAGLVLSEQNPFYKIGWKYFHAEELFQIVFCHWLAEYQPQIKAYHIKNEGRAGHVEMARKKLMGVKKGIVDLLLQTDGRKTSLWLELKYGGNKPTPEQLEFLALQKEKGDATGIPYNLFEAVGAVTGWLEGED